MFQSAGRETLFRRLRTAACDSLYWVKKKIIPVLLCKKNWNTKYLIQLLDYFVFNVGFAKIILDYSEVCWQGYPLKGSLRCYTFRSQGSEKIATPATHHHMLLVRRSWMNPTPRLGSVCTETNHTSACSIAKRIPIFFESMLCCYVSTNLRNKIPGGYNRQVPCPAGHQKLGVIDT